MQDKLNAICKRHKITIKTLESRMNRGLSLDDALKYTSKNQVIVYGNTYDSLVDVAYQFGILYNNLNSCVHRGRSVESVIESSSKIQVGNKLYGRWTEVCYDYGMDNNIFLARLKSGWSVEDALCTPILKRKHKYIVKDHLGNVYNSYREMCNSYGKSHSYVLDKLRQGWSLKDALEVEYKPGRQSKQQPVKDHQGNEFFGVAEMCSHYNIDPRAYHNRVLKGWSIEKTLTTPIKDRNKYCKDHLGNVYSGVYEMCSKYEIHYKTFQCRMEYGWSLEEALLTPAKTNKVEDHLGNKYNSITDMCKFYGISTFVYRYRKSLGWSLNEILTGKDKRV